MIMLKRNVGAAFIASLLAACAVGPQTVEQREAGVLVYPAPPDQPRFYFERTVTGSADFEIIDNETKWRRALTGEVATSTGFSKPFDVEVCQGIMFVSDTVSRQVYRLSARDGSFSQIGLREPGQLRKPLGMATDDECNLYVADQTAKRIVKYDQNGNYLNAFGGSQMFDRLSYVEVDAGGERVYAVDTGGVSSDRHHVRVIDGLTGQVLFDIGRRGAGDGELNLPRDIAIASNGNLYVVDGGNFRVQVFGPDGSFAGTMGSIGKRSGQFSRPKGIDTDAAGNVYVSDAAFGNFQIFNELGQLLLFVGDRGTDGGPGRFMLPSGLAVDEDGRVYMVDQYFSKVDVFRPADLAADDGFLGILSQR
jgi:DNA-binding beta-propeller fold protein YncE